jgi:hypothetical protein
MFLTRDVRVASQPTPRQQPKNSIAGHLTTSPIFILLYFTIFLNQLDNL